VPDEHSDKIISLLEEIRDLTKERNSKVESYVQTMQTIRQRYEESLQRQKEAQARALSQRRWFLWTLGPLLLLAIGFMIYLAFWVIPDSEATQTDKQMQEYRLMMQSNYTYMTNLWPNTH
jgi:t-SNARE complex subunit (syntaxin)